ncbi:hypothetical protein AOQ84DRAFT_358655 [Glonium stellatum]|uniref:Uncharacterized protein n=1 Tax=Glonium stellatum TaxID=574774 RepID=A0A8E2JZC1_9PEZI|nr:hypothetical protein AOQ84DRAFT_358655 [Glonium stellatum]
MHIAVFEGILEPMLRLVFCKRVSGDPPSEIDSLGETASIIGSLGRPRLRKCRRMRLPTLIGSEPAPGSSTDTSMLPYRSTKEGIIFANSQWHSWWEVTEGVTWATYKAGMTRMPDFKRTALSKGTEAFPRGSGVHVEVGLSDTAHKEAEVVKTRVG